MSNTWIHLASMLYHAYDQTFTTIPQMYGSLFCQVLLSYFKNVMLKYSRAGRDLR